MKKSTPKLTLHRETLRDLEQPQLKAIVGGTLAKSNCGSCNTGFTCLC
jgi:hypothetical protein